MSSTDRLFKVFNIIADNERAFVFVSVFLFVFVLLCNDKSTDRLVEVFYIIADNEGAFPSKFKGAPLQVGLGTCHLF